MLLLYHSHKHISYPIRTIARSAIVLYTNQIALCTWYRANVFH
ncbi:hypothetical protein [Wolbachia endosymbiont of Drosophila bicornuta]